MCRCENVCMRHLHRICIPSIFIYSAIATTRYIHVYQDIESLQRFRNYYFCRDTLICNEVLPNVSLNSDLNSNNMHTTEPIN